MMDDRQLLDQYLGTHSESAFSELVARNVDLVYSAALRLVGGDTLALVSTSAQAATPGTISEANDQIFQA
jgi:hypothetical protein